MRAAPRAVQDSRFSLSGKFTAGYRLLRENGFDHVIHAANISDRYFKVFFVRNHEKNAKLGIVVGKKTLSSAVDRNRAKRVIREAFRQHSIKKCRLDIVVMLKRTYPVMNGEQVGSLHMLFSRVENRCAEL